MPWTFWIVSCDICIGQVYIRVIAQVLSELGSGYFTGMVEAKKGNGAWKLPTASGYHMMDWSQRETTGPGFSLNAKDTGVIGRRGRVVLPFCP